MGIINFMREDEKAVFLKIFISVITLAVLLALGAPVLFKKKEVKTVVAETVINKYADQAPPLDPEPWYSPEAGGYLRAMTNTEIIAAIQRCNSSGLTYSRFSYQGGPTVRIECKENEE